MAFWTQNFSFGPKLKLLLRCHVMISIKLSRPKSRPWLIISKIVHFDIFHYFYQFEHMKSEVRKGKHLCGRELNSLYFTVLFYRFYDAVPNDTAVVSIYYFDPWSTDQMLENSPKQYFVLISKDRANRLYKEIYMKCIYWLEKFLSMGSKRVIWKLLLTKNERVSNSL